MRHFWAELVPLVFCVAFIAGVIGNLTASAVLGTPAVWHLHRKLNRQHQRHREHVSGELAAMEERLKAHADKNHKAVRALLAPTQPMPPAGEGSP